MKVFTITNMWPYPEKIYYGIFVREQVEALSGSYPEIENRVWFLEGYKSKWRYVSSVLSLNFHLLFHRYDIIHIHSALSGIFLIFAPLRKNVIITLHGTEVLDRKQYRISKHVIRRAGALICVSEEIESIVKRDRPEIETHVIPCAVRESFFTDNRHKPSPAIRIAFSSAAWREVKNYPLFKEIITRLREKYPEREILTLEFDNCTREEIRDTMNVIDLLLVTSLHEGSPQIIKEALCCNTPVVSANVGTVSLMLSGVKNCAVIDGYAVEDYTSVISDILMRDDITFPLRSEGRKRIYDLQYDEKNISSKIMRIYRNAGIPNTARNAN